MTEFCPFGVHTDTSGAYTSSGVWSVNFGRLQAAAMANKSMTMNV